MEVIMLPTNTASNIVFEDDDIKKLHFCPEERWNEKWNYQHLYIVSDNEIKEGDWFVNIQYLKNKEELAVWRHNGEVNPSIESKKIEATTNVSLKQCQCGKIEHKMSCKTQWSLHQIPQSFVKEFVKSNGKITEVNVEIERCYENVLSEHNERVTKNSKNEIIIDNFK